MKFQPSEDRLVIDPIESKKLTEGGIHIPDNALEKPIRGVILAVGPDAKNGLDGTLYVVGQEVIYHPLAGTEIELEELPGKKVLIMRGKDIFGTI